MNWYIQNQKHYNRYWSGYKTIGMDVVIARQFYFSGRVQGVGFRYTVSQIAAQFEVAGWVKNLVDGRVEVQVKGDRLEIERFVKRICSDHHLSLCFQELEELDADIQSMDSVSTFTIRH